MLSMSVALLLSDREEEGRMLPLAARLETLLVTEVTK